MKFNALVNRLGKIVANKKYSVSELDKKNCVFFVSIFSPTHSKTDQFVFKLKIEEIEKPLS